jgi:hypothetical protein
LPPGVLATRMIHAFRSIGDVSALD